MHHLPTVARNIGAETSITVNMKVKNVSLNVMLSFMNAVLGAGLSNPRVIEAAESSSAMVDARTKSGVIKPSNTSAGRSLKFRRENPIPRSDMASRT